MGVQEIRARTAKRKAEGAVQTYPEHAAKGPTKPAAKLPLRLAACADLGERVPGQPCGSPLLRCLRHGDVTSRMGPCAGAQRCCQTCPDYRAVGTGPAIGESDPVTKNR